MVLLGEVRAADANSIAISFDQVELGGKKMAAEPLGSRGDVVRQSAHVEKERGEFSAGESQAATPRSSWRVF
jgi:hypothetical protein